MREIDMVCKPTEKRNSVIAELSLTKKIRCDVCIRHLLESMYRHGFETIACCCGHGVYPLTIVCKSNTGTDRYYEVVSGIEIRRTRNFYKLDEQGFYYIPEVIQRSLYENNNIVW